MKEQIHEDSRVMAAAERQMRQWSLTQEVAEEAVKLHRLDEPHHSLGDYITISREAGSGGSTIAALVGQKLGWDVLDKNLVDQIAERFHLSKPMLELVDETSSNWAYDTLGPWLDRRIITHEKYLVHLCRIVLAAARRGRVVVVGRGAQLLLPRNQGMAVRLVASEQFRLEYLVRLYGCEKSEARRRMQRIDAGRREFAMRYFHRDINDVHLYDLVLQIDRFGVEGAADLIAESYSRRLTRTPETAGAVAG